jgi:NAD(P) transhydrogenase
LIHLAQCVIANGGGIDYFINTCFNYPSLGELYKYAAYSALQAIGAKRDVMKAA